MRTALYYPHTEVKSESLVRTALLTWDRLEFIIPDEGYRPYYQNRDVAEAMEIIGQPRSPSSSDRQQVHMLLDDLIAKGIPETFYYDVHAERGADYEMWPQKLLDRTWRLLEDHHLVGPLLANADYSATEAAGLTIMSVLADVMAGETRARVTDRGLAYATIANLPGGRPVDDVPVDHIDQVVPLTFKTLALEHVGLDKLIAFRKREAKSSGHDYRKLRHNYLNRLEAHIKEAAKHPVGSRDREEVDRIFEEEMEDDLKELRQELGFAQRDALLAKDTMAFVLAGGALLAGGAVAAALAAPIVVPAALTLGGAPATIGGMLGVTNKYAAKRVEVLRKHPMAYLYEIGR